MKQGGWANSFRGISYLTFALALLSGLANAQDATPAAPDPGQPTFMKDLAKEGKHNLEDERWNAYGQFTYIYGWKQAFDAPYTNLNGSINSLLPNPEQSFTGSATAFLGAKLWKGGEVYFVPRSSRKSRSLT